MQNIDEKRLINKALSAMENAYAPYSNFPVELVQKLLMARKSSVAT